MVDSARPPRRDSSVLNAILDRVTDDGTLDRGPTIYRQRALEQLDVGVEIDSQLPLVPRRTWLVTVAVLLACAAAMLWAGLTPSQRVVVGGGRAVGPGGLGVASAPADGTVVTSMPASGTSITAGQVVAIMATATGTVEVRASVDGTAWQQLASPGEVLTLGAPVGSILPAGSDRQVLLPLDEDAAAPIQVGMSAVVGGATPVAGTVTAVSAPVPADVATRTTAIPVSPGAGPYLIVAIAIDEPVAPGSSLGVRIIESDQTVLSRLLHGA